MARVYSEQMLRSMGIYQIALLAEYKAGDTVTLPHNEGQYTAIYNCGTAHGFYINYTLYELNTDDILFFDSDTMLTGTEHSEGKNTHFYMLTFKNGPEFLSLDDSYRKNLFIHISKY